MKERNEAIHLLLDGGLSPAEEAELRSRLGSDPDLQKDFDDLQAVVGRLEGEGRVLPPVAFTAAVMRKLPAHSGTAAGRIRRFLFGTRVLRWNMAAALALAMALAVLLPVLGGRIAEYRADLRGGQAALVRFTLVAPDASSVALAGDFNKWRANTHLLLRKNGAWTIEVPLAPGVYQYMFLVDGEQWVTDPDAETYRDDGFGSRNAVMKVGI